MDPVPYLIGIICTLSIVFAGVLNFWAGIAVIVFWLMWIGAFAVWFYFVLGRKPR